MKKLVLLIPALALILAACTPSQQAIQLALAKTLTAAPSPTPTPISLSDIDLRPILFLSGDLPSRYSAAEFRYDHFPEMYDEISGYDNALYQEFNANGKFVGWAIIFLYNSLDRQDSAYSIIINGFGESQDSLGIKITVDQLPDLGEANRYFNGTTSVFLRTDVAFRRCKAVVHIVFPHENNLAVVTQYAKNLDARLTNLICR